MFMTALLPLLVYRLFLIILHGFQHVLLHLLAVVLLHVVCIQILGLQHLIPQQLMSPHLALMLLQIKTLSLAMYQGLYMLNAQIAISQSQCQVRYRFNR